MSSGKSERKVHSLPTLSKSALLLSPCIRWADPLSEWYNEDLIDSEDHTKRDNGILFHRAMDQYIKTRSLPPDLPEEVAVLCRHGVSYLQEVLLPNCESPEALHSEVPVSIHWVGGKAEPLSGVTDRDYPDRPGWQNGTADIVAILKDGSLYVADWKTGESDGAEEQLLSLACGIGQVPEFMGENGGLRKVVISCLSVNEHGVWPNERRLEWTTDLDTHWDAMMFQWQDIGKKERSAAVPGIHCTKLYCPHLAYCEAIGDVVRQAAVDAPEGKPPATIEELMVANLTDKPATDQEAGLVQALVSAANRQIKYLTAANKDRVKKGGKVVCGQYVWEDRDNGYRWYKN